MLCSALLLWLYSCNYTRVSKFPKAGKLLAEQSCRPTRAQRGDTFSAWADRNQIAVGLCWRELKVGEVGLRDQASNLFQDRANIPSLIVYSCRERAQATNHSNTK